ncbi:MAG: hypothetical protein IJ806_05655 [Ruminococcus sp.]|nr:hypothetical protein [Ruminococcus sp.]
MKLRTNKKDAITAVMLTLWGGGCAVLMNMLSLPFLTVVMLSAIFGCGLRVFRNGERN